jgi:flagellar hook-associated protein 2
MLSIPGVGSGLDVNAVVEQLMALERRPLDLLEQDKEEFNAQLSAFGQLKSTLSNYQSSITSLRSLDSFKIFKASSSDEDAFTVSASSAAAIGSTDIQIINLAENHKMGSVSILDTDTTILGNAGDQFTVTIGLESFSVDAGGKTLEQIRDEINKSPENIGVSAVIINEDVDNHYLVLTSNESGVANSMVLSSTGSIGTDLGFTNISVAEDAELLVDGLYTITRSSNAITDAIDGLTINLLAETTTPAELTVVRDLEKVTESVQSFVDAYNGFNTALDELGAGDLGNDGSLRSIERRLRTVLNTDPVGLNGTFTHLSDIGLSILRDGTMTLNAGDLETAVNSEFDAVAELFAHDDQGYLFRLDAAVTNLLDIDGLIDSREDGINSRIDNADRRIESLEFRLTLTERRLRAQFTALDTLMGQLNGTSAFLTSQLSALPSFG